MSKRAAPKAKTTSKNDAPKDLPVVIALVGDEDRKKDRVLAQILEGVGKDASVVSWNADPVEKPDAELSRLLCDLRSRPLFGERRVVVARDGDGLLKRLGKGLDGARVATPGNHLVLMLRTLDLRTTLGKSIKKDGGLITCARPKSAGDGGFVPASSELVTAVMEEARTQDVALARDAAQELAARAGNDLLRVASELAKLKVYTGDGAAVTLEDVEAVVPRSATWDQFQLFQEVGKGDAGRALRRLRGMIADGTVDNRTGRRVTDANQIAMTVLYLLQRRVRMLARYRELQAGGFDKETIQKELGVRNPGQLYYLGQEAGLPLVRQAESAIDALVEADRDLKSSVPAPIAMERLLVRLCQLARPARRGA